MHAQSIEAWLEDFALSMNKLISGFMSTQILKLHPRDNSNTLSHSKLVQSLYTYPEAMAGNRRTVNIKETAQCSFRICVNANPETLSDS